MHGHMNVKHKIYFKKSGNFLPSSMFDYNQHITIIGSVWHCRFYVRAAACTKQ